MDSSDTCNTYLQFGCAAVPVHVPLKLYHMIQTKFVHQSFGCNAETRKPFTWSDVLRETGRLKRVRTHHEEPIYICIDMSLCDSLVLSVEAAVIEIILLIAANWPACLV